MGSLAEQITAKENLTKDLQDAIAKASSDAAAARKELDSVGPVLDELKHTSDRVAEGKIRLDGTVADADKKIADADKKIGELTILLETHKTGLPADLDKVPAAKLTTPPGPYPGPTREKLADYDAAVTAAAADLATKAQDVEDARVAKASALGDLAAAETIGGLARQALDAALADLTTALNDGTNAQVKKDFPAAGDSRFRIAQIEAWVKLRKQAVQSAATAIEAAADTFATKEKELEDAEGALVTALALLQAERALQSKARDAVAAKIIDDVKKA